jgi:hypothetical protein
MENVNLLWREVWKIPNALNSHRHHGVRKIEVGAPSPSLNAPAALAFSISPSQGWRCHPDAPHCVSLGIIHKKTY